MDNLEKLSRELVKMVNTGSESAKDVEEMIETHMKLAYAMGNREGFKEAMDILSENMGEK